MKSLTLSSLICALNLYLAQNCTRLLEAQKVAPKVINCSKVAEYNLDRPIQANISWIPESGFTYTRRSWNLPHIVDIDALYFKCAKKKKQTKEQQQQQKHSDFCPRAGAPYPKRGKSSFSSFSLL